MSYSLARRQELSDKEVLLHFTLLCGENIPLCSYCTGSWLGRSAGRNKCGFLAGRLAVRGVCACIAKVRASGGTGGI